MAVSVGLMDRTIDAAAETVARRGRGLLFPGIVVPFVESTADVERIVCM